MALVEPGASLNEKMDWIKEKRDVLMQELGIKSVDFEVWLVKCAWEAFYGQEPAAMTEDLYADLDLTTRQKEFLRVFDKYGGRVTIAYQVYGISPATPYMWRRQSSEFEAEYQKILAKHKWRKMVQRQVKG